MNKKWVVLILLTIIVVVGVVLINKKEDTRSFVNPNTASVPTAIPSSTPKSFKFDKTTDLKQELEQVDPQILDSDFE